MSPEPVPIAELLAHAEFVRGLARDLVRDVHRGDDLAQEVWLQTLRRPPAHGASLRGWLASLVTSLFHNQVRAERRRQQREVAALPPPPADTAADVAAKEQVRQRLLAAVMRLDEPFRTAVLLRYYEELTPTQIARRLAIPAATVRTRVARGLERLRAELDREHRGDRAAWALPLCAWPGVTPFDPTPLAALLAMKKASIAAGAVLVAAAAAALCLFAWPGLLQTERVAMEPVAGPARVSTPPTGDAPAEARTVAPAASERTLAAAADGSTAAAADEPMGDLLIRVTWADGSPAAGVNVHVGAAYGGYVPRARLVSDDAGRARTRVAAGRTSVSSDRETRDVRDDVEVDVVAGEQHEVTLKLAAGVDVAGVVRDGNGVPVSGARVWLVHYTLAWCAMGQVAESDEHGAFTVRAATKDSALGATMPGKAPSPLVDLETCDVTRSPVRIELVLADVGGAVAGRVVDERGDPVAGAVIAVGQTKDPIDRRVSGRTAEAWPPALATTDDTGSYTLPSIAPGRNEVEVWAASFPFWHGEVTVAAGEQARLDVTLPRGVTVHGVVAGEDGAPLANAVVRAFPVAVPETYLITGQYDYESIFGYPFAVADAQGRFRVRRIAPGDVHLYASTRPNPREENSLPWAYATMQCAPGAVVEWNPKVEPGPTIAGIVRYRDGAPMPRVFVTAKAPGEKEGKTLVADGKGRFRFVRLDNEPYDVSVQVWDPPKGSLPVGARDVWPDRGVLELVATFDAPKQLAKGTVRGVIVDAAGRAANPGELRVILGSGRGWRTHPPLQDGRFAFRDIEPGPQRLAVLAGEAPIHVYPEFELQPAETKDLGTITTEPGGKLTLRIVRGPGTENVEPLLSLRPKGAWHGRKVEPGRATELVVDNLCLGEHTISGWGETIASLRGSCVVSAGEPATATIELRAAVLRDLVIEYGPDQVVTSIRVVDEQGNEAWGYRPERLVDRPQRNQARLPLGKFTLRVETAGGGVNQVEFAMTSLDPDQPPVVVTAK